MNGLGIYTFMFTDIEGSTRLIQVLKDDYRRILDEHRRMVRTAVGAHDGEEIGTEGDSFFILFSSPTAAAHAAVDAQLALASHPWPEGVEVRVRMGLHTGEAHRVLGDVVGLAVHRAARIASAAHGGQIVASGTTAALLEGALSPDLTLESLGPHHLKDFDTSEDLFQISHPSLPAGFPPLRTEATPSTNLPPARTSFVGRQEELRTLRKILGEARLVTLTGAGGAGKTRLAQEAAAGVLADFPDGVWWVDLAPVADPDLVAQQAASAVGVQDGSVVAGDAEARSVDRLVNHLRARHALLVLDNCEHLVDACASFAEAVLRNCPHVRLLATSREPLGVEGETTRRVPSLPVPGPDATPEDMAASEAVRLFRERATAVRDDFEPTTEDLMAVAQICRRLDGLPLAIELAAARVRSLSCEQIAARLDDRFRLLTGGGRRTLPRQRTLEALVDWSHDLLSEEERALLRRLSVFSGGCFLEAAEAVCSGDVVDEYEIVDLLARLVDKSLVVADHREEGTRYGMLETIHQYAREKLLASGEVEAFRTRHLRYSIDFAATRWHDVNGGPEQLRTLDRFEAEHDNVRAALEWSMSGDERIEDGLRLAAAVGWFWWIRGHLDEGKTWLERILAVSGGIRSAPRAICLAFSVLVDRNRARVTPESLSRSDEAEAIARALGAAPDASYALSLALWEKGNLARHRGQDASVPYQEGLEVARAGGVGLIEGAILQSSAVDSLLEGDHATARRSCEAALSVFRAGEHRMGIARALHILAYACQQEGDLDRARQMWEETLLIARQLGDRIGTWQSLGGLIHNARAAGHHAGSRTLAEELLIFARSWGESGVLVSAWTELGDCHLAIGDLDAAREAFGEALSVSHGQDDEHRIAVLYNLGEAERVRGDLAAARGYLEEASGLARRVGGASGCVPLAALGHVLRRIGEGDPSLFVEALEVGASSVYVAAPLEKIGLLAADEGAWDTAALLLGASEGLRPGDWFTIPGDTEPSSAIERGREALGTRFDELFQTGEAMAREEAMRTARAWLDA